MDAFFLLENTDVIYRQFLSGEGIALASSIPCCLIVIRLLNCSTPKTNIRGLARLTVAPF